MSRTINDLRTHLFDAIEGLKAGSLDLDKARAIADIGQTVINSAKVEVDYLKATGNTQGSGFLGQLPAPGQQTPAGDTVEKVAGGRVITHRLKG